MSSGGTIIGDTIEIGGEIIVGTGGTASGLSLGDLSLAYSGTIALVISSGATVVGGSVASGTVYARAGATIQGLALGAGTTLDLDTTTVSSGQTVVEGAMSSTRTISGVTLSSGATFALETATVLSGGTLQLAGPAVQQVVVSAGGSVSGGTLFTSTAAISSLSSFIAGRLVGTTIDEAVVVQSGGVVSAATAGSAGSVLTPVVGSVTVQSGGLVSGLTLLSATEYGGLGTPTSRGEIDATLTVQAGGSATNVTLTGGAAVVAGRRRGDQADRRQGNAVADRQRQRNGAGLAGHGGHLRRRCRHGRHRQQRRRADRLVRRHGLSGGAGERRAAVDRVRRDSHRDRHHGGRHDRHRAD